MKNLKNTRIRLHALPLTDADDVRSIDRGQLEKMVDYFIEHSFTYFDTAYMYHDYTSEEGAARGARRAPPARFIHRGYEAAAHAA